MNAPSKPTRYRWIICALLFGATTINYIDRQILSLVKPLLDQELHWTNEQFGMVNSAFQAAYACGLLFLGWFIDRFGTKIGYGVSITFWSIAAFCHALVGSIAGFTYARIFLGVSEAGNFPSAIKAVAQWFPRKERAFATSLFNSGANVGAIFAPATVPIIAATWGWKADAGDRDQETRPAAAVVLIGVAGAAHQAWSANLFTTVSDMFPKRAIGSVIGLGGMAGSVGGMFFRFSADACSTASPRAAA